MNDRLKDARAKLDRADLHIQDLRSKILRAGNGDPYTIPLVEELDEDTGALHLRVAADRTEPETWGLIIGDALHNLRSSLESAWWQLAVDHLGREPTEKEAPKIQFPLVRPGGKFNIEAIKKWVGDRATAFAGEVQADPRRDPPNFLHPIHVLRRLSNIDKHRNLNAVLHVYGGVQVRVVSSGPPNSSQEGALEGAIFHAIDPDGPKVGDTLLTLPPGCWIRQPDVEFDAAQQGFISVDGKTDIRAVLASIHKFVHDVLRATDMLLDGDGVTVRLKPGIEHLPMQRIPEADEFVIPEKGGQAERFEG